MLHLLPTGLALLGTVLMALVIFAPDHAAAAGPAVSFAPPLAPVDRWPAPHELWLAPDRGSWAKADPAGDTPQPAAEAPARWPAFVDPSAAGCDASARLALVDALALVRAPWAVAILQRAHADESDPEVHAALEAALAAA